MSATAHEIQFAPSASPPERPDPLYFLEVDLQRVEDEGFPEGSERTETPELNVQLVERPPVEGPSAGPLVVEIDREGTYIVRDLLGAVYGAGSSVDEARAEFFAALSDHLAFLREHQAELGPRLVQQLSVLERLFPGR